MYFWHSYFLQNLFFLGGDDSSNGGIHEGERGLDTAAGLDGFDLNVELVMVLRRSGWTKLGREVRTVLIDSHAKH